MRPTQVIRRAGSVCAAAAVRVADDGVLVGRAVTATLARGTSSGYAQARGSVSRRWARDPGQPAAATVPDGLLAERVRTSLGRVLRGVDVPWVEVTVERQVVTLHGDVGSLGDLRVLLRCARAVDGVRGVRSALAVGLLPAEPPPAWSRRADRESPALRRLLDAAERGGVPRGGQRVAVLAVLRALAARIPPEQWTCLVAKLPKDARALAPGPGSLPVEEYDLASAVAVTAALPPPVAAATSEAVLSALRMLVAVPASVADALAAQAPLIEVPAETPAGRGGP